jgi:hypothetical protein
MFREKQGGAMLSYRIKQDTLEESDKSLIVGCVIALSVY